MLTVRLRRLLSAQCLAWWVGAFLLAAIQPFTAVHFGQDGWEDEAGTWIRSASETTQFERAEHPGDPEDHEVTLFAALSAQTDSGHAFGDGLAALAAMLALMLPLIVLVAPLVQAATDAPLARSPARGGAPPPAPWRRCPPAIAPPTAP